MLKSDFFFYHRINFILIFQNRITYLMTFMLTYNTFRTNIWLATFTKILSLFLRMFKTKFIYKALIFFSYLSHCIIRLSTSSVNWRTYSTKLFSFFFVINVIFKNLLVKLFIIYLPRRVKFLIRDLTSGEKNFLQVGQVRILEVLKSIKQIWQNVCPHKRILGILSLSL
jgi:hypothetical protein